MNASISCIVLACFFLVGLVCLFIVNFHFVSNPVGRRQPVPVVSLIVVMKKSCPFDVCTCTCYVVVVIKEIAKDLFWYMSKIVSHT